MPWMPPQHELLSPITGDDGSQIESIQLKPLFYAAQKESLERAGDDEDDQFFELALLATGLSVKELDQLKRPDYVSIAQYVMRCRPGRVRTFSTKSRTRRNPTIPTRCNCCSRSP